MVRLVIAWGFQKCITRRNTPLSPDVIKITALPTELSKKHGKPLHKEFMSERELANALLHSIIVLLQVRSNKTSHLMFLNCRKRRIFA